MTSLVDTKVPKSRQMRVDADCWDYCAAIAEVKGFKSPIEALHKIVRAHRGWSNLENEGGFDL